MKHSLAKPTMTIVAALAIGVLPSCAQQSATLEVAPTNTNAPLPTGKRFVHPSLLHTDADFARMKAKVEAKEQPWLEGWEKLITSPHAQLDWRPRPVEKVIRGAMPGQNFIVLANDVHAAYQLALRWKVSGDEAYARKSVEILNVWSGTLKEVTGNSDTFLAAGIYGYEFANAAEIMRTYPGWPKEDLERFQNMMLTVFYPRNHDFLVNHNGAAITNYWANWDLSNIAAMQAIGVLCDRRDIYDEAVSYFKNGRGNGALDKAVYYVHPGNLGQWQEAGRDQGHSSLGIALSVPILETAWHQGDDLYGYDNNRFLAGAEYVAKYNLENDVPFQPYAWGSGQRGSRLEQTEISPAGRGALRAGYEAIINHYVHLKGIAAPYSELAAAKIRPEIGGGGHGSSFDQLGFGTLTATIEPQIRNPRPSGLTARKNGDAVVLSWWGAASATSYTVKRATKAGGPYATIATDVTDWLTYSDKGGKSGTYFYTITGQRDGKETPPSNEVRVAMGANLLAQMKFDEPGGKNAMDAVTGAPLGTLENGATLESGKFGKALALDGSGGYAALPEGITANLADFSVAAWVFLNDTKPWARIFDFGDDRGRYLFLTPNAGKNGKLRFATSTVYGYNEQFVDGQAALPTCEWVHVTFTLSGRVGTLYVNGKAVGSNPAMDIPPFQIGNLSRNFIGRSQFPNDPFLNGKVDDFRIYDGALTAQEVAVLAE